MTPAPFRPLAAALWMCGSIVAFTTMAVSTRQIAGAHDTFEILAIRSAIGLVLVLAVGGALGRLSQIRADRVPSHILRNSVHFTGQALWFWAITLIPLAQVFALEFTSPIWVILLAPLVLGEALTARKLVAAALGFAGILIVARPDFANISPGVLAAAAAAFFFAATTLITKVMTRDEPLMSILFWLTLIQLGFATLAAGWDGIVQWPTTVTLPWLGLIGIAGVCAHLCLTSALSMAPAGFVVPVDFARLPVIAVIGALFFDEPLEWAVLGGAAIIFAGIVVNLTATPLSTNEKHPEITNL